MNHMYQVGPQQAVRSFTSRLVSGWDTVGTAVSLHVGADYASEIPFIRFDYREDYNEREDGWKFGKHCAKHGNFMEGAELFDNKIFGLSPNECRGMDPMQRVILETSYESLLGAGFTKKTMMRSLIGIYLGTAVSEFVNCPAPEGSTGTSCAGAPAGLRAVRLQRRLLELGGGLVRGQKNVVLCQQEHGVPDDHVRAL